MKRDTTTLSLNNWFITLMEKNYGKHNQISVTQESKIDGNYAFKMGCSGFRVCS